MNKFGFLLSLVAVTMLTTCSFADDAEKEKKKGGNQLLKQTLKTLEKAELTDEQKEQIAGLAKERIKDFNEANKATGLTKEVREAMGEARKAAMAEGKSREEAAAAAEEAGGLSDEQKAAMAQVIKIRTDFMTAVKALLTDEQKATLGQGKGKGKKGKKGGKKKEAETGESVAE